MDFDVASRRVETKMEETVSGKGGQVTNLDLPEAHGRPNMVYGLNLQTSQLPCHLPFSYSTILYQIGQVSHL